MLPKFLDQWAEAEEIGRGTYAVVYRVKGLVGSSWAVKCMSLSSGGVPVHLLRELWITGRLVHPQIVQVREVYYDAPSPSPPSPSLLPSPVTPNAGCIGLRMSLCQGTLQDRLLAQGFWKGRRPLSLKNLVMLFLDLLSALQFLHSAGFVHRDVAGRNVLVSGNRAWLSDFGLGISRYNAHGERRMSTTFMQTSWYRDPQVEQHDKKSAVRYTPATDMWSVGMLMMFALRDFPTVTEDKVFAALQRVPSSAAATESWPVDFVNAICGPLNQELLVERFANELNARVWHSLALKCLTFDPAKRVSASTLKSEMIDCWWHASAAVLLSPVKRQEDKVKPPSLRIVLNAVQLREVQAWQKRWLTFLQHLTKEGDAVFAQQVVEAFLGQTPEPELISDVCIGACVLIALKLMERVKDSERWTQGEKESLTAEYVEKVKLAEVQVLQTLKFMMGNVMPRPPSRQSRKAAVVKAKIV